jgi:hypothetical protein
MGAAIKILSGTPSGTKSGTPPNGFILDATFAVTVEVVAIRIF